MEKGYKMKPSSRKEYLRKIYSRYQQASRSERRRILDEFCANCGYNRKYAIRVLNGRVPLSQPVRVRRRRGVRYGVLLISILKAIWEAADYPWSVRLKALLPEWMPWIRRRFRITKQLERQLLAISPRTMDYRLAADQRKQRRRLYGHTKPGPLLKHQIPLRTDRWDVHQPGFTEIDLVAHSGSCASGEFCHSLNLTDIHTTWTESRAVLGKSQQAVRQALDELRQALPFPLRGIDSDNGSEFINDQLHRYCRSEQIQFTRGRPYKKDDNAHIEQKNWTPVRRLLGYVRYDSGAALEAINDLYRKELRLFQNLFLPSVQLQKKVRAGSRLRRRYDLPQTPFHRLRACADSSTDHNRMAELQRLHDGLDPFVLSQKIQTKLAHIFSLASQNQRKSTVSTDFHRLPQKEKSSKKERENDDDEHVIRNPKKTKNFKPRVTFLNCRTITQKLHS